ncbi:MAG TPA: nucleotidyltransferase domain-containing protein [Candidatus Nanoarchaeia archaeon]|nr:nucleotidyltransferase domain-containing protein [Candidatus Nanoarchaeia archaeon]
MFIENILGSKAKVKILRVLTETRTAYSLKSLRDETELSLSIAHKAAEELTEEGTLTRIRGTRKEKLYKFNADSPYAPALYELFRLEKTRQRKEVILSHTWSVLEHTVSKIKHKSEAIILFGSQARGDATLSSDIDLLAITKNSKEKLLEMAGELKSKNKKNLMVLSLEAFKEEIKNNTLFYRNIKKDGIILHLNNKIKKELAKFLEDINYKETENGQGA